ncbi:espin-like protein [Xenentodon cancila]
MTEADLNRIEKQIENLQVMHKVSEVEKELEELERELHQLLPVSAALNEGHFSVNPKQMHGQAEDLPAWCSKISTLLKSMAILLATLGGKEIDILDYILPGYSQEEARNMGTGQSQSAVSAGTGFMGRSQSFSTREDVEKEIKQCGVSVKNLKANYEIQNQSQSADNKYNRVYKRKRSLPVVSESRYCPETTHKDNSPCSSATVHDFNTNGHLTSPEESLLPLVEEPVIIACHAPQTYVSSDVMAPTDIEQLNQVISLDPILNSDQLTRSLEVQTDLSYVQACIEMRKERIVFLFLEHWRKYTISESYQAKYTGRRESHLDVGHEDYKQFSAEVSGGMQSEDDKLLLFMKSKQVVGNLIGHWRTIMSQVPTRQIRRLSRAQMVYWPEHFLPHINGSPVRYESLTLDLFMVGYFQLLEMNMSRSERKFRHLLCYEMFDRLGSHKWEVIRQFHKEVMEEIQRGKRDWADGFEDIKLKYFGDSEDEGGVMTASLHSVSPDMSILPMQETLPPPPSHPPPPPPPPTHPAPPPQSSPIAPQPDVSPSPGPAQHGLADSGPSAELRVVKDSSEDSAQENATSNGQMPSDKSVSPNGTTSDKEHMQNTATERLKLAEAPQDRNKSLGINRVDKPTHSDEPNEDSIKVIYELKEFSNEEIIRYIDRSFAFWKEKEAELFDI